MTPDLTPYMNDDTIYNPIRGSIYLSNVTGLKVRTVRKYAKDGLLPGYFIRGHLCLPKQDLIDYLNGDFVPGKPSPVEKVSKAIDFMRHREPKAATA